jgi:hypothetical protein
MLALARRLADRGVPCLNIIFHSSEVLPGGSPYAPDETSVTRFLDDLRRLLDFAMGTLGAVGRTYGEFQKDWDGAAAEAGARATA